jgi:hypothetical protein
MPAAAILSLHQSNLRIYASFDHQDFTHNRRCQRNFILDALSKLFTKQVNSFKPHANAMKNVLMSTAVPLLSRPIFSCEKPNDLTPDGGVTQQNARWKIYPGTGKSTDTPVPDIYHESTYIQ